MTYQEVLQKGLVHDASGISHPDQYNWTKGELSDCYYPDDKSGAARKHILAEFHQQLISKDGVAVLINEDNKASAVILPKLTDDAFIERLITAIDEELDADCQIAHAVSFDHGYVIVLSVAVEQDGDARGEKFNLSFATKY